MTDKKYSNLHKKTKSIGIKRILIDLRSFLEVKSILYENAVYLSQQWVFQDKIDHFQALSLIDWCKVLTKKRGEIRQALREKGIDEALSDKIKDRKKIEEPKALGSMCQILGQEKQKLEYEKQVLIGEINYYQQQLTGFQSPYYC